MRCVVCDTEFEENYNYLNGMAVVTEFECCSVDCFTATGGKVCSYCGRPHKRPGGISFCCSACNQEARKEEIRKRINEKEAPEKTCIECKKVFRSPFKKQKYCSDECYSVFVARARDENRSIKYFDVFQRDEFRCQYCGRTPRDGIKLVVDHIYPLSKGGENAFHNMITACQKCNNHKSNKKFPLQQILRFWTECRGDFTYKEAIVMWNKETKNRDKTH